MSTPQEVSPGPPSFLGQVAQHEERLVGEIEAVRRQARDIEEGARAKAALIESEAAAKLEQELTDLRATATAERAATTQRVLSQMREVCERTRASVRAGIPRVVQEIVGMALPQ